MLRRSVTSGVERRLVFVRSCCAPIALVLLFDLYANLAFAQSPKFGGPALAAGASAEQPLPPPASHRVDASPPAAHTTKTAEPKVAKPTEDLTAALDRPGELNLHGVSLDKALFMIGEQWNINIVAGDVKGTVNGTFKQAPLREILDAILLSNGYNYRAVGKSLVVSSIEQLGQINPFFQSAIIPVQSADIDEVVQGAQLLKTPKGEVRPIKSARSIVVLDFPDRVKMIREFVATLDSAGSGKFGSAESRNGMPLEVGYFRTQHISAKTAEQALQAVLSKSGKAAVMDKEDRLLVTDYADNLAMIERVMQSIDRPRPQVRVTALIYDISLQDIEKIGVHWNQSIHGHPDATGKPQGVIGIDSITQVPFSAGTAGSAVTFMNLSKHFDITAVIQALQGASDARLLADPHAVVQENEEAVFQKVQEIPYQQLTQTQQGGSIGTTSFKNVGIELHVTPKISAEGIIRMIVNPKVSRLVGFTPGDNQPIIDTSSASTTLTVANRQTVVIGGLKQRSDVGNYNGIPYLKDLNVVGRLFRSHDLDVRESELVVFVSPEIVSYDEEPDCREKAAEETVRCRLDQVPEAEGCPPFCHRLPQGPCDGMAPALPPEGAIPAPATGEELPPITSPQPQLQSAPEPEPANQPAANDAAASAARSATAPIAPVRLTAADPHMSPVTSGQQRPGPVDAANVRRLPNVVPIETRITVAPTAGKGIFAAPAATNPALTPADSESRAAEREQSDSIWR